MFQKLDLPEAMSPNKFDLSELYFDHSRAHINQTEWYYHFLIVFDRNWHLGIMFIELLIGGGSNLDTKDTYHTFEIP